MAASQRNKGMRAERELFALLSDLLGIAVQRNYAARWEGGCDSLSIPGWAIEAKRHESLSITAWWAQTQKQADHTSRRPILFYRQSRRPWRAVLDLQDLAPATFPCRGALAEIGLEAAAQAIRESLEIRCHTNPRKVATGQGKALPAATVADHENS